MADSEVEIVNLALDVIAEDPITSIETPTGSLASRMARQYSHQRDALIQSYNWTFARERTTLTPDGTDPPFGYESRFRLPSDCLRFLGIFNKREPQHNYTSDRTSFKREGRFVLADGDTLDIFYLKRVTNVGEFDPLFVNALAGRLAVAVSYKSSVSKALRQQAAGLAESAIKQARRTHAIEDMPEEIVASDWLDAREDTFPHRIGPVWW